MHDIGDLMPHAPPIRMIDRVESQSDTRGVAEVVIVDGNPFVTTTGAFEPAAFVEMMAQAFAAWQGLLPKDAGVEHKGMLVAVNSFEVSGTAQLGDTMTIDIELVAKVTPFFVVDGTVGRNGEVIAKASLRVVNQ
jgi:predicted hotdog family 3-hydroxylacyl-ACP dehydratase